MTGTIKRVIHVRGFGFIIDERGAERFFHASDLEAVEIFMLRADQRVEFEPVVRPNKGLGATKVRVL